MTTDQLSLLAGTLLLLAFSYIPGVLTALELFILATHANLDLVLYDPAPTLAASSVSTKYQETIIN